MKTDKTLLFLILFIVHGILWADEIDVGKVNYSNLEYEVKEIDIKFDINGNDYSDGFCYYFYNTKNMFNQTFSINNILRNKLLDSIKKVKEWAIIAEQNSVKKASQVISDEQLGLPVYIYNGSTWVLQSYILYLFYSVETIDNISTNYLIFNYKSMNDMNNGYPGSFMLFNLEQLDSLESIINDSHLMELKDQVNKELLNKDLFK